MTSDKFCKKKPVIASSSNTRNEDWISDTRKEVIIDNEPPKPRESNRRGILQSVVSTLTLSQHRSELEYRRLFKNMPIGCAYHEIVVDDNDNYIDYIFIEVNDAFLKLMGLSRSEIIGKKVTNVFPEIQEAQFDWIGTLGKIAQTREKIEFDQYFEPLERWLSVSAYSPERGYFITLVTDITEQKIAEETIRNQHDFLEIVKESLTHPLYVIDANDYTVLWANESSGFDSLDGCQTCYSLTHGRNTPCEGIDHPCPLKEVKAGKKPVTMTHAHYKENGDTRLLEIHVYPIFDAERNVTKVIEYALDITGLQQAEMALIESESRYRELITSSPEGIGILDLNEIVIFANQALAEILGYPCEELIGMSLLDVVSFNGFEKVREENRMRRSGIASKYEMEMIRKDSTTIIVQVSAVPQRNDGGEVIGTFSVISDITKRKQAEDALRKSEASLAEAQMIAHLGSWEWDLIRDELHWSNEMYRIFGRTSHELSGSFDSFLALVHFEDKENVQSSVEMALTVNEPFNIEHRIIHSNGSERVVHTQGQVTFDEDRTAIRLVGTVQDITKRKRIDEQLQKVTKRAMLYLDLMGHDIANQLQIITMSNAIIEEEHVSNRTNYLSDLIDNAVQKCEDIISKTRHTEQLAIFPLIERNLDLVITDCIELLRGKHNQVRIETVFNVANSVILADEFLEHMLNILIENAILHNPNEKKSVWVEVNQCLNRYAVSIADNGPGIDDSIKNILFDPAQRIGGVGLHQVKEIVEKYKGRINVYDRIEGHPELGVEFQVLFPSVNGKMASEGIVVKKKENPEKS